MSLRIYTVKAGKHDFSPPEARLPAFAAGFSRAWEVVFDATCEYYLPGEDQGDFNKGGGVSLNLLSNNRNAIMWAWRYNPKAQGMQIALYVNRNGAKEIGHDGKLVQIDNIAFGQKCRIELVYLGGGNWVMRFFTADKGASHSYLVATTHVKIKTPTLVYRLGLWFGGNQAAPQTMQVWVDYKNI